MKRILVFLIILCLIATLTFPKSKGKSQENKSSKPPAWIITPYSDYPQTEFLAVVGEGGSRSEAEVRACEALAAIFEFDVKASSKISERFERTQSDGVKSVTSTLETSEEVKRFVNVSSIFGVEFREYWDDDAKTFALAVLDKKKSAKIYTSMIEGNNTKIAALIALDTRDEFSLESYARLDFATVLAGENERLLTRLAVIDVHSADLLTARCASAKGIAGRRADVARQIPIHVEIEGDVSSRLKDAVEKALSSFGFRTSAQKYERYSISGSLKLSEYQSKDKSSVQCRYEFSLLLNDTAFGQSLLAFSDSGRSGSSNYDNALSQALRAIDKKIENEFSAKFKEFLNEIASE